MSIGDQLPNDPEIGKTKKAEEATVLPLQRCPYLYIKDTPEKGRGVFSSEPLPASTILDTAPVLPLSPTSNETHIAKTELYHYTYNWPSPNASSQPQDPPTKPKPQALILGLGSMFNHSNLRQNVGWTRDPEKLVVTYRTIRDVEAGEELCISYGAPGQLTFEDSEAEVLRKQAEEEARREGKDGEGVLAGIEL